MVSIPFLGGKQQPQKNIDFYRQPATIVGTPELPSKDLADLIAENKSIPREIKEKHWSADLVQASFSNLNRESRQTQLRRYHLKNMMLDNNIPRCRVYDPNADLEKEQEELDYELALSFATTKALTDEPSTSNLMKALTSASSFTEVKTPTQPQEQAKKKGGLFGFLGL